MKASLFYTLFALLMFITVRCNKPDDPNNGVENNDVTVTVTTNDPSEITATTAICGAEVTANEGFIITELGVCWSTNATPTVEVSHLSTEYSDGHFICIVEGLEPNTKYYVCAYAICEQKCYYGEIKSFTTLTGLDNHDFVDLGLPSGILWATCNVGANTPEEYGDYFAWGEITPKTQYNWETYKYSNDFYNTLTKYCNNVEYGNDGFTDELTTLLPEDDAANAILGGEWRMPTADEWQELFDNTTASWGHQGNVKGVFFTALNGNSIFLPAAGHIEGSSYNDEGEIGNYWSSSLYTDYPWGARGARLKATSQVIWGDDPRNYGQTIRPVRSTE